MKKIVRKKINRKSFTLVEIMLVVSIIVLLVSIAIPSLLRSRLNADEITALRNLRTIGDAAVMYRASNSNYPANLGVLSSVQPSYIDQAVSSGARSGYDFALSGGVNTFSATAIPQNYNTTGIRSFFIDQTGVIRWTDQDAAATALDQPIS